ncbi:carcinoembryonic antigen-related cell adhesion molecule 1-like [Spea bombifrons]|uniref:carcinoembryonic antigen-related cell adhesion molecule 1-like n=1 Tax=Spea bombifrons TaxID=233779 RepID=UPI00234AFEBE|nr:carcinoembryonic antigen-related cell adhesion molecule 1-like [Spea bombifrons]
MGGRGLVGWALLLLTLSGAAGITISSPDSGNFVTGANIYLRISHDFPNATIMWKRGGVLILQLIKGDVIGKLTEYKDRLNAAENGSLLINKTTAADAGTYTVTISEFGEADGVLPFQVKFYDLVKNVTMESSPASVDERTPVVNLSCSASRSGETFTWQKDGGPLPGNYSYSLLDGNRTLQIKNPNRTHNGDYVCNVSNPVDWAYSNFTLRVSVLADSSLSPGAIAGIAIGSVLGALLLIALIILIILMCLKRRKDTKEKNPDGPAHKTVLRTVSGSTLSPDDPAYFTMNNIMYRSSSISMGSYILPSGEITTNGGRTSINIPSVPTKTKHATQV